MNAYKAQTVTDSEFAMWRAVFAFSLVDNMLTLEEQRLLQSYLNSVPFSPVQLDIIKADFKHPQNVETLFQKITEPRHRERFCVLARALVWCEGNMIRQEEEILRRVACLGHGADFDMLRGTRNHPHLEPYYREYARAGMVGLMKSPPLVQMLV